ncbi:MAG TPA: hypothetical protein VHA12_03345 [Candidatus Nanoarchaeia archaeon]|nr:hypothetical protein [Candidatus Nanoarchaeia archaeon]
MQDPRYQTHWTAGLASANPKEIRDKSALIISAAYTQQPIEGLTLTLRLKQENLEGKLLITSSDPFGMMSEEEFKVAAKKAISDLYSSFEVKSHEELVGKDVCAKIFHSSVIGIQRGY